MQQMESEGKKAELTSGLRASMGKGTYGVEIIGNFNKNGDTPWLIGMELIFYLCSVQEIILLAIFL